MSALDRQSSVRDADRDTDGVTLTPAQSRARRQRNIAIGVAVALLCALFYAVTIAKLGSSILKAGG
ncbi:MAG: hypothetical protein ACK5JM_04430 [Rhodoblastus sp.]